MAVRALYLRASGGRIPELKRVIVVYQNQIVMAESLEGAIDRIFPRSGARPLRPDLVLAGRPGADRPAQGPATQPAAQAVRAARLPSEASTAASPGSAAASGDLATLAARAQAHYDQAIKAQRDGDWARYGEELKSSAPSSTRCARPADGERG